MRLFASNFLRHPTMLGSVIPSSRFLIDRVLGHVDWHRSKVFVEFGPGVGTFTTEILQRMRADARLIAFEINSDFQQFLASSVDDERFELVTASAAELARVLGEKGIDRVDYVLSGIPFTTIPRQVGDDILRQCNRLLHDDGRMLVYQFTRRVLPMLERHFGAVEREFEPLNVMPAFTFTCSPSRAARPDG